MSDVTFGVKVTEEMKSELSELMKISDLSGKEFMGLLLSTYKIEQAKQEDTWFANDMSELQVLLQRIQNLYLHIGEKSKILLTQNTKQFQEEVTTIEKENALLKQTIKDLEDKLEVYKKSLEDKLEFYKQEKEQQEQIIQKSKEENKKMQEQVEESQIQAKNYLLLHNKFEQEIRILETQVEELKRLELEIEERNKENTSLQNRNDELASEVWFLKREAEKLAEEKNQLTLTYQLELKNHLLEQKLAFNEKIGLLKEENLNLQQDFNTKLQSLYETKHNKD